MAFESGKTLWHNPTENVVHFVLFEAHGERRTAAVSHEITIPPGGEMSIPSSFDHAIQREVGGNLIGHAPALVRGPKPAEPEKPAAKTAEKK